MGYNYHTARHRGTATVGYGSYHPVVEPPSLVHDILTTTNGIVYQWNKQPNMEILIQNKPVQHLNLTRKLLILYTVSLQVTTR